MESISTTTQMFVLIWKFFNFAKHFTTQFYHIFYHIFYHKFYHIFYHKFYHKLLLQTTIIIMGSISTTTPFVVPIRQFFNFTTHFTTHFTTQFYHIFYHTFYHKLLLQTTIITMGSIFTTTPIIILIQQFFNLPHILPQIIPQILPQTTTTISNHTPMTFSVPEGVAKIGQ